MNTYNTIHRVFYDNPFWVSTESFPFSWKKVRWWRMRHEGFQKISEDFLSSPKSQKRPHYHQIFCAVGKILKKQVKTGVFRQFLELIYVGAQCAFRKILGSVTKNGYLKIVQRGTVWVGRGSKSWEEKRPSRAPALPLKSAGRGR